MTERKKTAFGRLTVLGHQVQAEWKRSCSWTRSRFKIQLAFEFHLLLWKRWKQKAWIIIYINNKNYISIEYFSVKFNFIY